MRKHYFLGQAATFGIKKTFRFLFSFGTKKDFEELKQILADRYNVEKKQVWLFHSGRTALTLALLSQIPSVKSQRQIKTNDKMQSKQDLPEVAITALTCYAVVQAVKTAGYQPVYLDIDPKTLHFNGETLSQALKEHPNIKAVVVQNNLGIASDILEISQVAKDHHLMLIEDLAHSFGINYNATLPAGGLGDAIILSFGKGKAIDAISGGALIMRKKSQNQLLEDPTIANSRPQISDSLRDRFYPLFGLFSRILSYIPVGRRNLGQFFISFFVKIHFIKRSADAELDFTHRLTFWQANYIVHELSHNQVTSSLIRQPYFVDNRSKTLNKLKKSGYYFDEIWYDIPVSPKRYYQKSAFNPKTCPIADLVSKHLVNLPIYYSLAEMSEARLIIAESEISIEVDRNQQPKIKDKKYLIGNKTSLKEKEELWIQNSKQYPLANFLQSPKWQKYNELLGHKVINLQLQNHQQALMIVKDAKRGRYLEISNGPLIDWSNIPFVTFTFAKIYQIAKQAKCVFIRFRPALEDTMQNQNYLKIIKSIPASFHLNAEHTVFLDLTKSEDELLSGFRRQTRYEVRRAAKLKITAKEKKDSNILEEFHAVQLATAKRQHFIPPTLNELKCMQKSFGNDLKIYVAYNDQKAPIAYGLILIDGVEADYYEAASTPLNQKLPGAYALQWQVIQDLKKKGIKRYNFWGIAPVGQTHHRYAGVTTFKTGFSNQRFTYIHAQDIPIKKIHYQINRIIESLRKRHRHLN